MRLCYIVVKWDRWQQLPHPISLLQFAQQNNYIRASLIIRPCSSRVSYFIIFLLHHPSSAPLSTLSSSWPHPLASKGSIAEMSFASAERSQRTTLGGSPPGLAAHGRRHPGGHRLRTGIEHIKIYQNISRYIKVVAWPGMSNLWFLEKNGKHSNNFPLSDLGINFQQGIVLPSIQL